jgi:hypothetical protein
MVLFCGYMPEALFSPASRHILGNVQTSVGFESGIGGKHLFDRASPKGRT